MQHFYIQILEFSQRVLLPPSKAATRDCCPSGLFAPFASSAWSSSSPETIWMHLQIAIITGSCRNVCYGGHSEETTIQRRDKIPHASYATVTHVSSSHRGRPRNPQLGVCGVWLSLSGAEYETTKPKSLLQRPWPRQAKNTLVNLSYNLS